MLERNQTVAAVIPARAGSVRIKNKNLMLVNEMSLLQRKVRQLKGSKYIDRIILGTNCEIAAAQGELCGAEVVWREDFFCDETKASANEMIADLTAKVSADIIVWAHCTNPFLYKNSYDDALEAYSAGIKSGDYDSLVSVYKIQSHMWNSSKLPENFNPKAKRHPLGKDLKPVYFQDGGIFIQTTARFRENSYFYGDRPFLFELEFPNCHDINTSQDLLLAQKLSEELDGLNQFF